MPALTIRNLPDAVHAQLRSRAGAAQLSVESFIRQILAEATAGGDKDVSSTGFAETPQGFIHDASINPAAPLPELWGALKGSVRMAAQTDLTSAAAEDWFAPA